MSAEAFLAREAFEGVGCLVLDQHMPGMLGTDLQEELKRRGRKLPCVFLTAHADIDVGVLATRNGAVEFLIKPAGVIHLAAAVETALSISCRQAELRGRLSRLTTRECEVLTHVIAGRPNKQIAAALGISEDTVKVHRRRVMRKVEADSVPELVRLCLEAGIEPAEKPER